jgi:Tfp pilus assembly major pilin PilA
MFLAGIIAVLMFVGGVKWQQYVDRHEIGSIVTTEWGGNNERK